MRRQFSTIMLAVGSATVGAAFALLALKTPERTQQSNSALAANMAGRLLIDCKTVEFLRNGDSNAALGALTCKIDESLLWLAMKRGTVGLEGQNEFVFQSALAFRKTNSWLNAFEDTSRPGSEMAAELKRLLSAR